MNLEKGWNKLRIKFEYNYRYPHEVAPLASTDSYAIIYQTPFNGFGRVSYDNIYSKQLGDYSPLISTKAVEWFEKSAENFILESYELYSSCVNTPDFVRIRMNKKTVLHTNNGINLLNFLFMF